MTKRTPGAPVREPWPAWHRDLGEFARMYEAFHGEMRRRLESYPSAHLRELVKAAQQPTTTNCGWSTYAVAPSVSSEARAILYARERGVMQEPGL